MYPVGGLLLYRSASTDDRSVGSILVEKRVKMKLNDERLIKIVPSDRQVMLQMTEFYAFFHFTVNTFTGTEWGYGTESPEIFNPDQMDAYQWVQG